MIPSRENWWSLRCRNLLGGAGCSAFLLGACLGIGIPFQESHSAVYRGIEEILPMEVAPQPVAFSHRLHVSAGISCVDCHRTVETRAWASLPDVADCLLCHAEVQSDSPELEPLHRLAREGRSLEWVRVYRVPDFVFFDHSRHTRAGVTCATCHGPVEQRDVLAREVSTGMIQCMNCHEATKVPNHCHFCHSLGH